MYQRLLSPRSEKGENFPAVEPNDTPVQEKGAASKQSWSRWLASWVMENPLAALTSGGLAIYGFERLSAALFYGRLGVTPEEVGLGYAQILTRSIYGLASFVLVWVAFNVGFSFVIPVIHATARGLWSWIRRREPRRGPRRWAIEFWPGSRETSRMARADVVTSVLLPLLVVLLVIGTWGSFVAGNQAKRGQAFRPRVTSFSWQAEPAFVFFWGQGPAGALRDGQCVLFLGSSNGVTVVFVPDAHALYRLPTSEITLQTSGTLTGAKRCPTAGTPQTSSSIQLGPTIRPSSILNH